MLVLRDRDVGETRLEKEQRLGIFALNGRSNAAEMLDDELRQEVAELRRLRPVCRGIVLNGLGTTHLVDPDYQRLHVRVPGRGVEVQTQESEGNERHQDESDFEIGVDHERRAV